MNAVDAMAYDPANLIYANGAEFSLFKNPTDMGSPVVGTFSFPYYSAVVAAKIGDSGHFGIDFTNQDFGEVAVTSAQSPDPIGTFHAYQCSFAIGYAAPLNNEFAVGSQLRYATVSIPDVSVEQGAKTGSTSNLLFSLGLAYKPEALDRKLDIGFSLMDFGTSVKYNNGSASPPSQMNIGIEGLAVTNEFFDVGIMVGATKPFDKSSGPPDYSGQSSFKSLFNDWSDFPEDVTAQAGLGFVWHPIYLGGGVSCFQEMYVGYFSTGPKSLSNSFYTHGVNVGIKVNGTKAALGYAGRWHNNQYGYYLPWLLPWETFQFTLSTDSNLFGGRSDENSSESAIKSVIVSGGYSYGAAIGRMKLTEFFGGVYSFSMKSIVSAESDFYISENEALISSLSYSRMTVTTTYLNPPITPTGPYQPVPSRTETISVTAGFRYHPLELIRPLFVQAGLGVIRLSPMPILVYPKYSYKSFSSLNVGAVIPVLSKRFVVIPQVAFRTFFAETIPNASRLAGYNQFEFGLNLGYGL